MNYIFVKIKSMASLSLKSRMGVTDSDLPQIKIISPQTRFEIRRYCRLRLLMNTLNKYSTRTRINTLKDKRYTHL